MPNRKKGVRFGEWLDITMSNQRMMGRTLAEAIGVHDSAVSRWRAGNGVPSMDVLERMASVFEVDALRLAVTAGQVPGKIAGVDPLPIPVATAQRENVRRQLSRIKGVTDATRRKLLSTYEELIIQDEEG